MILRCLFWKGFLEQFSLVRLDRVRRLLSFGLFLGLSEGIGGG